MEVDTADHRRSSGLTSGLHRMLTAGFRLRGLCHRRLRSSHRWMAGEPDGACSALSWMPLSKLFMIGVQLLAAASCITRTGAQYVSIRYSERLAEAGIEPSVGSVGDSYENAWQKRSTVSTRLRSSMGVDHGGASRQWNSPLLNGSTGSTTDDFSNQSGIPPAEAEERYYAMLDEAAMAA